MNTAFTTPSEPEWSAVLMDGLVEIHACQVAGFWLVLVLVAGQLLPVGAWERGGSAELN